MRIEFFTDWKFIVLTPSLNFCRRTRSVGIEWLGFGVYISRKEKPMLKRETELSVTTVEDVLTEIYR